MRVCLVVGSDGARFCGVRDYSLRLAEALRALEVDAEVRGLARAGGLHGFDVVHVQYPAIGFRYSLKPMLLGWMGVGCVVATVHEYGAMPWVQRVAMQGFRVTARGLVFTTEAERGRFGAGGAWVIGIGSNVVAPLRAAVERNGCVVYFGQVRPEKGLEEFLALAARMPGRRFLVLGAEVEKHRGYLQALRAGSPAGVEWILNEELERVAERMSEALAAYLPFPDGATLKRGSLLGALVCGLPVVTAFSAETPDDLRQVVLGAATLDEAVGLIEKLAGDAGWAGEVGERGRRFAERFSWDAIAREHMRFYEEQCGTGSGSRQGERER